MFETLYNLGKSVLGKAIDVGKKYITDPEKQRDFELDMRKIESSDMQKEVEGATKIITTALRSKDPWVRRARPFWLWMFYALMGFNHLLAPLLNWLAALVAAGFGATAPAIVPLAIPAIGYKVFVVGYLGYVGGRSYDKKNGGFKMSDLLGAAVGK